MGMQIMPEAVSCCRLFSRKKTGKGGDSETTFVSRVIVLTDYRASRQQVIVCGLTERIEGTDRVVRWQGEDFVARLDEVTGTKVFSGLFEEQIKSRPFPEYDKLFERLGIHVLGGHPIFVDGVSAQYRNAIMAPR